MVTWFILTLHWQCIRWIMLLFSVQKLMLTLNRCCVFKSSSKIVGKNYILLLLIKYNLHQAFNDTKCIQALSVAAFGKQAKHFSKFGLATNSMVLSKGNTHVPIDRQLFQLSHTTNDILVGTIFVLSSIFQQIHFSCFCLFHQQGSLHWKATKKSGKKRKMWQEAFVKCRQYTPSVCIYLLVSAESPGRVQILAGSHFNSHTVFTRRTDEHGHEESE